MDDEVGSIMIKGGAPGFVDANVVPRKSKCGFAIKCGTTIFEYLAQKGKFQSGPIIGTYPDI